MFVARDRRWLAVESVPDPTEKDDNQKYLVTEWQCVFLFDELMGEQQERLDSSSSYCNVCGAIQPIHTIPELMHAKV